MTQRRLDLALLVGIGILLLVILILALSAAPRQGAGDISDPVLRVTPSAESDLEPVAPVTPEAGSSSASPQTGPVNKAPATSATQEEGVSPQPAPDAVPIRRIGFAYATGTAGACGVPLTAWSYVAVSRDLLETYPCGTAITLTLSDEVAGRTEVVAQVGDTMGADITDTVNVFVGEGEPALEYGVTSGTLSP